MFFQRVLVPSCRTCPISKTGIPCKLEPAGQGQKSILLIGTCPSLPEAHAHKRNIGSEYEMLAGHFIAYGIDIERDCWRIDAVNCMPVTCDGKRRDPTDNEIECCHPMMEKFLESHHPHLIILMGTPALKAFYKGTRLQYLTVEHYRTRRIPDHTVKAWVTAIYSPDDMVSNSYNKNKLMIYDKDIASAMSCMEYAIPAERDYMADVQVLTEFEDVKGALTEVIAKKPERFVFDYEANAIKPYRDNTILYSMSFKTPISRFAYSFPVHWPGHWSPPQRTFVDGLLRRILAHRLIGKIAHNMGMEDSWSFRHLSARVTPWKWDTMISQHIIDTMHDTKGLKVQAWYRFGIRDYDEPVEPYLKGNGGDGLNLIHKAPMKLILSYGGMDSLVTDMLYVEQVQDIIDATQGDTRYPYINDLFRQGGVVLNRISQRGFRIDRGYYTEQFNTAIKARDVLIERLMACREVRAFRQHTGKDIKLDSNNDLRFLLFNILGVEAVKKTKKDEDAVDKEVLQELGTRFSKNMLEYRKVSKIISTYVGPFLALADATDRIHPDFNLHIARSGRSSSSNPNFQNLPKRDPEAKKYVRRGIIPDEGFHFCEADYGSLEVRIFACHCKDPALLAYVHDPTTDMHRDQSVELFMLPSQEYVSKKMRTELKSGWVFAEFYGSYYKSCARKMWDTMIITDKTFLRDPATGKDGITLHKHLTNCGILTLADFEAYLQDYEENKFWARFPVVKQYREDAIREYLRKGYIETMQGFRRGGLLNRNKIINTPTQGTGFINLLWSLVEMDKLRLKEGWKSFFVGQIHDSINSNIHTSELQYVLNVHHYIMCEKIREVFPWIIVPLEIEVAIAPVNAPWYDAKDFIKIQTGDWVQKDLYRQNEKGDWFPKEAIQL